MTAAWNPFWLVFDLKVGVGGYLACAESRLSPAGLGWKGSPSAARWPPPSARTEPEPEWTARPGPPPWSRGARSRPPPWWPAGAERRSGAAWADGGSGGGGDGGGGAGAGGKVRPPFDGRSPRLWRSRSSGWRLRAGSPGLSRLPGTGLGRRSWRGPPPVLRRSAGVKWRSRASGSQTRRPRPGCSLIRAFGFDFWTGTNTRGKKEFYRKQLWFSSCFYFFFQKLNSVSTYNDFTFTKLSFCFHFSKALYITDTIIVLNFYYYHPYH